MRCSAAQRRAVTEASLEEQTRSVQVAAQQPQALGESRSKASIRISSDAPTVQQCLQCVLVRLALRCSVKHKKKG
jgi:hypothetical protein